MFLEKLRPQFRWRIQRLSLVIEWKDAYGGPGQRSPDYSAFGQITGLCPCQLQALNATWLAWQRTVQGVIPMFIVGLSVYTLF
jgi:hypothetical protein